MSTLQASSVTKPEKSVNRPAAYREAPRHRSGWKSLHLRVPGGYVFEHSLLGLAIKVDGMYLRLPTADETAAIARILDDDDARFAEQCRLEKDAGVAAANQGVIDAAQALVNTADLLGTNLRGSVNNLRSALAKARGEVIS